MSNIQMDNKTKKSRPDKGFDLSSLVKSNVKSNNKNYRVPIKQPIDQSQEHQTNSSRSKTSNENEQTTPKPLLDCLQAEPLLISKPYEKSISQRRRKNKPFDSNHLERSNDDDVHKPEISPGKSEIGRSTIDIREPTSEQIEALRFAFDQILSQRSLSEQSLQQRQFVFMKLQKLIREKRADAQVILYGSIYFECCLEKPGIMDIDVQFNGLSQYETLQQLLELLQTSDLYKEAAIDTEYKPSCINLITNEPNMRLRITSGFLRGIYLSKLIRIYTKFDERLIKLLRLVRILAKICNIDKPDIGTLHPIVYHIMIIHFLQQIEPPVLPCLHEYAYGIDHVPLTLTDDQYPEFLNLCEKYSKDWQTSNSTNIEMLFLQFLSYYVKTFNVKQFVVSIQTRMPVMKVDKNWHSRKLLIEDPTDIKRSLSQTMSSIRSIDYFREIFNTSLNYFGRKQKQTKKITSTIENTDEDLIEIVNDDDDDEKPTIEQTNLLHNSYKLFYKHLPPTVARDVNIRQTRVREFYKQILKTNKDCLFKGLLKLNLSTEKLEEFNENFSIDDEQHLESDNDDEQEFDEEIHDQELFPTDELEQTIIENQLSSINLSTDQINSTTFSDHNSETIPSPLISPRKIRLEIDKNKENSSEFFYDFKPENFHAEQGAPYVCTICNGVGHLKNECPELLLPNMIDLPIVNENWTTILSKLCRQITDRSKPTDRDIDNRKLIIEQLEQQISREYPACHLHAFGSFYNGFGFHQSDLDVCLVFKDQREQNNEEVLRILQRILRIMKSSNMFDDVQPVLHAKVPIIRSRHRQFNIEIDISLHNMLAIENTRLLKTYTDIDVRVSELGYMIKHLAKLCGIADASRGTLSSYAYIIMLIHFLQQTQPPVLPVLQQLSDDTQKKTPLYKKCSKWNVYFYDDLTKIKQIWKYENQLTTGGLWIEFLRYYTELFNYDEHVVTIRQIQPLLKHEKGWFKHTIAIEDPFELTHNLAGGLSPRNWTLIRRVFIRARQQFGIQLADSNLNTLDMKTIEESLFNIDELCPTNAPKRCEWCKGPYHIRKRCPKLAALASEKEKNKRYMRFNENSQWNSEQQYYSLNENSHTKSTIYSTYSNSREYTQTNHYHRSNHYKNTCFNCRQPGHLRAQCPIRQRPYSVHQ